MPVAGSTERTSKPGLLWVCGSGLRPRARSASTTAATARRSVSILSAAASTAGASPESLSMRPWGTISAAATMVGGLLWRPDSMSSSRRRRTMRASGSPARAGPRADDLDARMVRRRLELDMESGLHNSPPTIVAAALIVPQGLIDKLSGEAPAVDAAADKMETDRRAVAAVVEAERALGRNPEPQTHSNPGFDVLSVDPATGIHYFIDVKGHLPQTTEISVSAQQVQKAKGNPERWRLAVVSVPNEPDAEPTVQYLLEPFQDVTLHFAQTKVPMNVANLLEAAGEPR